MTTAVASDLQTAVAATYPLYQSGREVCSGTFIRDTDTEDLFLTAAHCVDNRTAIYEIPVRVYDDESDIPISQHWYRAVPVVNSSRDDMAVLRLLDPSGTFETADVLTEPDYGEVTLGTEILTISYPAIADAMSNPGVNNFVLSVTEGIIGQTIPKTRETISPELDVPLFQTTAPFAGGSSGGGVYVLVDGQYRLFGIIHGGATQRDYINLVSVPQTLGKILDFVVPRSEEE